MLIGKTRPRKRRLIARWDSSTGEDTDSDIRRKPSNWDAHQGGDQQDGRDDDDQQDGRDDSEEACQDGLGDPNTSGITPPIPTNLVEPNLAGHENAIHVVTSGLEVGLFTNKCVFHRCFIISQDTNFSSGELQMRVFTAKILPARHSQHGP